MKRFVFLILLFSGSVFALEGPIFRHKDSRTQQETENIYQAIRTVLSRTGSSRCIDEPTLCVDTVNNLVGVGTTTPSNLIDAFGVANTNSDLRIRVANGGTGYSTLSAINQLSNSYVNVVAAGSGVTGSFNNIQASDLASIELGGATNAMISSNSNLILNTDAANAMYFRTNNSTATQISSVGEITQPLQPSFLSTVGTPTANVTGDGTVSTAEFATEVYDQGSDYNNGTYTFTAPVSGRYLLTVHIRIVGISVGFSDGYVQITTSNRNYLDQLVETTVAIKNFGLSVVADMDANDTAKVEFQASGGAKTAELSDATLCFFSGSLIN